MASLYNFMAFLRRRQRRRCLQCGNLRQRPDMVHGFLCTWFCNAECSTQHWIDSVY